MRIRHTAIGQLNPNGIRVRDDVVVGHYVARLIDDHPGTETAFDPLPVLRQEVPEKLAKRLGCYAFGYQARRIDVHDRRGGALHGR